MNRRAHGGPIVHTLHTAHKEKEKGAKRKRNDYYDDCYPPIQGGPFPTIEVGRTGLSNTP